jgi:hypothetical protein
LQKELVLSLDELPPGWRTVDAQGVPGVPPLVLNGCMAPSVSQTTPAETISPLYEAPGEASLLVGYVLVYDDDGQSQAVLSATTGAGVEKCIPNLMDHDTLLGVVTYEGGLNIQQLPIPVANTVDFSYAESVTTNEFGARFFNPQNEPAAGVASTIPVRVEYLAFVLGRAEVVLVNTYQSSNGTVPIDLKTLGEVLYGRFQRAVAKAEASG